MTVTTTTLADNAQFTTFRDVDDVRLTTIIRTVAKPGTPDANRLALQSAATSAIATLNAAEAVLAGGAGAWDAATAAQRTTLMLGLTRDVRALIRITLGILDAPS